MVAPVSAAKNALEAIISAFSEVIKAALSLPEKVSGSTLSSLPPPPPPHPPQMKGSAKSKTIIKAEKLVFFMVYLLLGKKVFCG
jgi:hypothetical protein